MLDFQIRSTSIYNPINMCFEKKETFPLLTYTHLSILRHHSNLYNYANPFERQILNAMLEQDILTVITQRHRATEYMLTPPYLLKTHHIDTLQDDRLMNPQQVGAPPVPVVPLDPTYFENLQRFLTPLLTFDIVQLQFEVTPSAPENSDTYFYSSMYDVSLYAAHSLTYGHERPTLHPEGHLRQLIFDLLNQGVTSIDVSMERDAIILQPYLLGRHRSLHRVRLLPE